MVTVNGKELDIVGTALTEYLKSADYKTERIAVELNGDIVPKAKYDTVILQDGDALEVVSFVGGG